MADDCKVLDTKMKQRGLRMTKQRAVILEVLTQINGHPNAGEIHQKVHKEMPHISFGTVYRSLKLLEELGLAREIRFGKHFSRYDRITTPHQHFTCSDCGQIMDIDEWTPLPSNEIRIKGVNLEVKSFRLDFYGICDKCQKKWDI